MRISDLKPRDPVTVSRAESLRGAAKLLVDDDIGALAVVGVTGLNGILSERDLARAVADGIDLDDESVESYMTEAPVTVDVRSGIGDAIGKMNDFGVRHLVVVDEDDVVGIISMRDLMSLMGTAWPEL